MHERPRLILAAVFLLGLVLHVALQPLAGFNDRAPRILTIAIAVIGLRWGSVAGAFSGALGGFVLALFSGEPPFPGTLAMTAAGLLAGEVPARFIIETYRAVALAVISSAVFELALVGLLRGSFPANIVNVCIWTAGWAVVLGVLFYWLAVRLATPPTGPRLTDA